MNIKLSKQHQTCTEAADEERNDFLPDDVTKLYQRASVEQWKY